MTVQFDSASNKFYVGREEIGVLVDDRVHVNMLRLAMTDGDSYKKLRRLSISYEIEPEDLLKTEIASIPLNIFEDIIQNETC